MRKRVKMMVAAAVCAVTMFVVGCGNADNKTVSDAPAAVEEATPVDSKEKFVGEWKLAYIESDGVTVAGDLSGLKELAGEDISIVVKLANEGTGSMSVGPNNTEVTWELVDDDNIKIKLLNDFGEEGNESKEPPVIDATYGDGELRLDMSNASADDSEGEEGLAEGVTEGVMVLTPDGTSDKIQAVTLDDATKITSKDALVGDWNLCGIGMFGLYMYGDTENVSKVMGDESNTVSFKSDDTCKFFDADGTYKVGNDGAVVSVQEMGDEGVPVLALGDDIVVDMSTFFGALFGSDKPLFMVYSK